VFIIDHSEKFRAYILQILFWHSKALSKKTLITNRLVQIFINIPASILKLCESVNRNIIFENLHFIFHTLLHQLINANPFRNISHLVSVFQRQFHTYRIYVVLFNVHNVHIKVESILRHCCVRLYQVSCKTSSISFIIKNDMFPPSITIINLYTYT